MVKRIVEAIDTRLNLRDLYKEHLAEYMVPAGLNFWYSLGSVLLALFFIEILTGILLLMHYIPSIKEAFNSVSFISNSLPFGWLIRRVHAVGANLIVIVLFLHMISVLIMGTYKKPREMHWFIGCFILGVTLLTCLSGYLLPWSQLSYWATTVATSFPGSVPHIGEWMVRLARGGDMVSQVTLGRFLSLHVSIVPFTLFILVGVHLFLMRRTGISTPPWTKSGKKVPFFPHFVLEDLKVVFVFLAIFFLFVFFFPQLTFPPDSLVPANPLLTPEHLKPEWYFLANYQIMKLIPSEFAGILFQLVAATFIFLLPVLDRSKEGPAWRRPIFGPLVLFGILAVIGLTIWGHYS